LSDRIDRSAAATKGAALTVAASRAAAPPPGPFEAVSGGVLHAAHEAIVAIDETQRIVMLNPAAQRMFGCTLAEALGSAVSRFIPARYHEAHSRYVREFAATGAAERSMSERLEVTGLRANGDEFPVAITITRIEGAGPFSAGRYFAALLRDLSTEQGLRHELDALRRRYQSIFELSPNAIWITEGERIVYVNRACVTLLGAGSPDSVVGASIYSLLRPESRGTVRREIARALAEGTDAARLRERVERLDGKVLDVEIALAALPDHGRTTLQMVIIDMSRRRREGDERERSRQDLRRLSQRMVEAREDERRRIARELHDELGQRLTALKMEVSSLRPALQPGSADGRIDAMLEMLDETVASVRRIAADLRPLMLDDLGLGAAIEWLARDAARHIGIEVTVRLGDGDPPLGDRATIALYRMVQEALTNVARHAHATDVHIEMNQQHGMLVLTVRDNGVGFSARATQKEGSYGLMGIRERALMLGGWMEVDNPPGGGGRVTVRLPLEGAADDAAQAVAEPAA
jgi:PAS domain S-box-containing protein